MKPKSCPICKEKYTKARPFQVVCDKYQCAIEYVRQKEKKKFKAETRKLKAAVNDNNLKHQHKLTQKAFNKMRKLQELKWFSDRNMEPECISCGKTHMDWCCGHFKTTASQGNLRYDEINTYLQCNMYCNKALSGNIHGNKVTRGYTQGLRERFGNEKAQDIIEYCETQTESKKWTPQELKEMRKQFNAEIRKLESYLN